MFRKNWLGLIIMIFSIMISCASAGGWIPPDSPSAGSPEPVSTAFIGSALLTLYYKAKKN